MKRKLRALSFFALSVFLIVSCNKYNKMLDWENMEIDGNMNWGIPLINADYSMEKILDQFGDMDFIKYESNGNFYFEYTIDEQEFVNVDDFNSIPEATQTFNLDFLMSPSFGAPKATMEQTFPGNTIDISTEDVRINTATLNSGSIKIDFSHISMPANVDYDAYIKSKTLFYANGAPFLEQVSKSNPTRLVNATGLKVVADDSQLDFEIRIVLRITGTPPMGILPFNPEFSLINLKIKEAEVELLKEFAYPITNNSAFSLFSHNLSLDATVYGAKLDLNLTNTFGFDVRMKLAKAYLKERNHTQSILLEDNSVITIPRNHTGVYSISDRIKNEIRLTTTYDSLAFEFIPFLAPGIYAIQDNSALHSGASFTIPFNFRIDEAVFNDTLTFGFSELNTLSILDTVIIRTAFGSSIPSNFNAQFLLYNSKNKEIIGELLSAPVNIKGSYTGELVQSTPLFFIITNDRIKDLQKADRLILQLSLNTNGQHRPFNKEQILSARVGVRIRTANNL